MSYIKLAMKDADKMLAYFRNEIETKKRAYESFQKKICEVDAKESEIARSMGLSEEMIKGAADFAKEMVRKTNEESINNLVQFIEILTCGSSEVAE